MSANEKMLIRPNFIGADKYYIVKLKFDYNESYNKWISSIQPCEISESELFKVKKHINYMYDSNPIEVTDIIEKYCKSECHLSLSKKCICPEYRFKQPKQVEEIEAVEFVEWMLKSGYKLNPHFDKNRWRHIDMIESNNALCSDGYTSNQLYQIFKNRKK